MDLSKWAETYEHRASWALLEFVASKGDGPGVARSDAFEHGYSVGSDPASGLGRSAVSAIEDLTAGRYITRDLRGNGVAQLDLTREGEQLWLQVTTHRSNARHRARAAQDALLRWLYDQTPPCESDGLLGDVEACHYLGSPFEPHEVHAAGRALLSAKLIDGELSPNGPFPVIRVTERGESIIEDENGDVAKGLRRPATGPVTHNTNVGQLNVGSDVGPTNIAMQGDAHQDNSSVDLGQIVETLTDLARVAREQDQAELAESAENAALVVADTSEDLEVKKTAVQAVINTGVGAGFAAMAYLPQLVTFVQSVV